MLGSLAWLTVNRDEVDALNVFPVPDGDTGTNMLLTLQSSVDAIRGLDEPSLSSVARQAAHGALMGARGNSGVILSQVFRGFSAGVGSRSAVDARGLAEAFTEAAAVAYRGHPKPIEGTMLTVARAAADAASRRAADTEDLTEVVRAACEGAREAVERTPEQLDILRQAGVVDAGGFGLQVILEGFLKRMRGESLAAFEKPVQQHARPKPVQAPEEGWGYCTEFVISGDGLPVVDVRQEITRRGQSALVVGDESTIKVHVHTQEPADVIGYARGLGSLSRIKVDDMSAQHHRLQGEAARPAHSHKRLAVVAVASGEGLRRILESLGVDSVVSGGQTMNPSTQDLLAAVESVPSDDVVLLPNNGNIILAAQQVPELTKKRVKVVHSRSVPQGISALLAFDFSAGLEHNADAMQDALGQVQTIEVTHAVRDSETDGIKIKEKDVIGLLNDRLVESGGTRSEVVCRVARRIDPDGVETVTVYAGADAPEKEREEIVAELGRIFPQATVELQSGDQPLYPYIIAIE
jgi:DAK2 domain fusion protein YloV